MVSTFEDSTKNETNQQIFSNKKFIVSINLEQKFTSTIYEQTSGNKLSNNWGLCSGIISRFAWSFPMRTWLKFDINWNTNVIELDLCCDCGEERKKKEISFSQTIKSTHKNEIIFLLLLNSAQFFLSISVFITTFYIYSRFWLGAHNFLCMT